MQMQDAILNAIDAITKKRIDQLQLDKTVLAEIVKCTNALSREYKCSYNGGYITAYAMEGATYTNGQSVYVLIPQNDITKRKSIVGLGTAKENDQNISFVSSALSDYNLIGKNPIIDSNNIQPVGLHSYKKEEYFLLYDYNTYEGNKNNFISLDINELNNNIKDAEALMIEASFQTRLPKAHKLSQHGVYGLQFVLAFNDQNETDQDGNPCVKYIPYVIDSNNMSGNPFRFEGWSEQYQIFPIDTKNFLYIDSILFYEKDFVESNNTLLATSWGPDIFIKDIEFYPLQKINAVSGNYKLSLSMPKGSTLNGITAEDQVDIVAKVMEKNVNNLSDNTTFYWFKEDNRITPDKSNYQMYGGAGWAWLKDKGNNYTLYTAGNENRAYENKYLCVAVYKESVILKTYFTIYNEAARRDITIESSLGFKFSFDRGIPTLTCLINGKSVNFEQGEPHAHDDSLFKFIWAKIDEYNNTTIFTETYDELQKRYDELLHSEGVSYHDLSAIKTQMVKLKGVSWKKNQLTYPVSLIDNNAKFRCSVFLRDTADGEEYLVGSAEILLQNEGIATPTDYYITIENGDQVFQYSESGVSPNDERYTDPLKINPLICHFFDPAGLEVNKDTYDVKWVVPLEKSMIVVPTKSMLMNNANNKIEWYVEEIFPLVIAKDYDYQALNNQITAIVSYKGQEYQQDTNLLFTKIGENGTNGTDIVAKISSRLQTVNNELLSIVVGKGDTCYNDVAATPLTSETALPLQFDLFQRNIKLALDPDKNEKVQWSLAGAAKESKFLSTPNTLTSQLIWNNEINDRKFRYQIVKANVKYEQNDYYAFYPMPVIQYNNAGDLHVGLKQTTTLKSITYNSDGRNPLYNKNQHIELDISGGSNNTYYIVWSAEGGEPTLQSIDGNRRYDSHPFHAAFKLFLDEKDKTGSSILAPMENDVRKIHILPNDVYNGEYTNNLVHAAIYTSRQVYLDGGNTVCDVYVPIYMSLNVYGLKSLNAWDGNHVEINEDENYVLAPQMGAGKKNNKNQFTGILMGTSQTYDQKKEQIGLLGYSEGKQSIWLDAETGKAVFGLPEQQATQENKFTEGRIELVPGGESKIGQWRVGSRAIYNMTRPDPIGDSYMGVEPIAPYDGVGKVEGAQIAVPHDAQGIILNANPAYASYKGKPLTKMNSNIRFDDANAAIREGDSFEVEIDPAKDSAFTIYRHTLWDHANKTDKWHRYPLVGINAQGQFYTNAIENEESSMGIGKIGAFGNIAADGVYVGAQFGYDNTNLFKFFIQPDEHGSSTISNTLFLTAGTTNRNEYARPLSMNFKSIGLYADSTSIRPISDYSINLSRDGLFLGHSDNTYLELCFTNNQSQTNKLVTQTNLEIQVPHNRDFKIKNEQNDEIILSQENLSLNLKGTLDSFNNGSVSVRSETSLYLSSKTFQMDFDSQNLGSSSWLYQQTDGSQCGLRINSDNGTTSSWCDNYGLNLTSHKNGGITIVSEDSTHGVKLDARLANNASSDNTYLSLVPAVGNKSIFNLSSGCGTIRSAPDALGSGYSGLSLSGSAIKCISVPGSLPGQSGIGIDVANKVRADSFYFRTNLTGVYNGTRYSAVSIWAHLEYLYKLLEQTRADAARNVNDLRAYANRTFAKANHTHSQYALKNHTHTASVSTSSHLGLNSVGVTRGTVVGTSVVTDVTTLPAATHKTSFLTDVRVTIQ